MGTEADTEVIRTLVVDDHRAVADALAIAIESQPDLTCVGVAGTVAEAVDLVQEHHPDVVLMDVRLADGDGVEATSKVKAISPDTRVVVLTAFASPDVMARAASAGACGFLPKETPIGEVIRAIRSASDGEMIIDHSTMAAVLRKLRESEQRRHDRESALRLLSPREQEVLELLGEGMDPQSISKKLNISIHTARGYVKSILSKLEVRSQLEAVVKALRQGLLAYPEP